MTTSTITVSTQKTVTVTALPITLTEYNNVTIIQNATNYVSVTTTPRAVTVVDVLTATNTQTEWKVTLILLAPATSTSYSFATTIAATTRSEYVQPKTQSSADIKATATARASLASHLTGSSERRPSETTRAAYPWLELYLTESLSAENDFTSTVTTGEKPQPTKVPVTESRDAPLATLSSTTSLPLLTSTNTEISPALTTNTTRGTATGSAVAASFCTLLVALFVIGLV